MLKQFFAAFVFFTLAISAIAQTKAPPTGTLLSIGANTEVSKFLQNQSVATVEGDKLKVVFAAGKGYPNVWFPLPEGGWDLSAFAGVQVELTNAGDKPVSVLFRVDNAGKWEDTPWNTSSTKIAAGETKLLRVIFGQDNDSPGYPIDAKKIVGMQVFLVNPKEAVTLVVSDLRAFGSAQDLSANALSKPSDRDQSAVIPDWLGKRPPVEGDWVVTLDENFDGEKLNEQIWTCKDMDEPYSGALQRYKAANAVVKDGELRINIKHEPIAGNKRIFTTAGVNSYDKFAQVYGYFECRAKISYGKGQWPAFWMMPDRGGNGEWWERQSTGGGAMEIDIMEIIGEWGEGRNNVAVHWDGYGDKHKQWGTSNVYFGKTPDAWHNYGLLWEPGKLTWYVDGVKKAEFANDRVSKVPGYIILCTQMGGWASHDVDMDKINEPFRIDYVRVWQLKSRLKE